MSSQQSPDSVVFPQVCFTLNEDLTTLGYVGDKDASLKVPRVHPFTMHTAGGQTLAIFSQSDTGQSLIQVFQP